MITLEINARNWQLAEPFAISRGVQTQNEVVEVSLRAHGRVGQGEALGVMYAGETQAIMVAQLESVRGRLEAGVTRQALMELLPAGGARCAADAALWDLQAKTTGVNAYARAGFKDPRPVLTAFTIGIRSLEEYRTTAGRFADFPLLKVKVGGTDPVAAVTAVREGAPNARLIVDPNQAWSVAMLRKIAPELAELGVVMLEQPIPVGAEAELDGYDCPILLCADELVDGVDDLAKARGRFGIINIKLEKAGGLTQALSLADAAEAQGFRLMVGCMGGSSLAMAPAHVLAQRCAFVDLDGPLLQLSDRSHALKYCRGFLSPPNRQLWG